MKGMVFTEFIEMVETQFSIELADKIIEASDLPSGGAYTAVGTYDFSEMLSLVTNLSIETGIAIPDLLHAYGKYLFHYFAKSHGHFLKGKTTAFEFLLGLENHVHTEVKKLYADAELPSFDCSMTSEHELTMVYHSERKLADFAHGLIESCMAFFEEEAAISREDLSNGEGRIVRFVLTQAS